MSTRSNKWLRKESCLFNWGRTSNQRLSSSTKQEYEIDFFHAHRGHSCLIIERYHTGIQFHTCGGRYGDVCNNYTLQRNNRHLVSLMRTTERWHSSLQLHKCGGKYQNGSTHVVSSDLQQHSSSRL